MQLPRVDYLRAMEDSFAKYLRLFGSILLSFLAFVGILAFLLLAAKLFFGVLSYIPWINYLYIILILMFPTALFLTAYFIFWKRTKKHPSTPVRLISYFLFCAAIVSWIWFFVLDLRLFFKYNFNSIDRFHTYNLLFLFINVACIFFVGVMQALSTEKEKDWMERSSRNHDLQ